MYPLPRVYEALLASGRVNTELIYGTELKKAIHVYKETFRAKEQLQWREKTETGLPAFIRHLLNILQRTPLLIPFCYGDELSSGGEDRTLHLTQAAAFRVNEESSYFRRSIWISVGSAPRSRTG